jgi:hypothetical protein
LEISQCGRGIADEQADHVGSARRVLVCRLWIARPAISASGRWVLKHLPSEVRFGNYGCTLGGTMGQRARTARTFLEGDVLEVEYAMAARVLTHVPAEPRHKDFPSVVTPPGAQMPPPRAGVAQATISRGSRKEIPTTLAW